MARLTEHEMCIEILDLPAKARALFDEVQAFLADRLRTIEGSRVTVRVVHDSMPERLSPLEQAGLFDEVKRIADS